MACFKLDRKNALLLIIDIQERLLPAVFEQEEVLKNTETLIRAAQIMEMPILVTEQYPKGLGKTVERLKKSLIDAPVIEKMTFSACVDELMGLIEVSERRQIIVVGMETHVCVFQTVRDLLERGYEVYLPLDALASRTRANYMNALRMMERLGAVISNTETLLFDLMKIAGTPEFKTLSALIK